MDEMRRAQDHSTYTSVGWTLLGGLLVSIAVMIAGLIAIAVTGDQSAATRVLPLDQVLPHLTNGKERPSALLDLGILLLFAAPLANVLVALVGFVRERDMAFVAIALLLLLTLFIGFAVAVPR